MPVPWRSLVARWGRADGPAGSVLVGKVSAPFDGVKVAVTAIDSRPEFFSIGVEVVPGLRTGLPYGALEACVTSPGGQLMTRAITRSPSRGPGLPERPGPKGPWGSGPVLILARHGLTSCRQPRPPGP